MQLHRNDLPSLLGVYLWWAVVVLLAITQASQVQAYIRIVDISEDFDLLRRSHHEHGTVRQEGS